MIWYSKVTKYDYLSGSYDKVHESDDENSLIAALNQLDPHDSNCLYLFFLSFSQTIYNIYF